MATYEARLKKWQTAAADARKAGKPVPHRPRNPRNLLTGQHRPGNLYNGVLKPSSAMASREPFGIKARVTAAGQRLTVTCSRS